MQVERSAMLVERSAGIREKRESEWGSGSESGSAGAGGSGRSEEGADRHLL